MLIAIVSSIIIISDFITKRLIINKLGPLDHIDVLPFLRIVYVENRGAAFGLFSNLGNGFFITVAAAAIILILLYAIKISRRIEVYAFSLILGGAAGNLLDRLTVGKVIDFIDFYIGTWHWPAFNIADSALTVGIILFIIFNIFTDMKEAKKDNEAL